MLAMALAPVSSPASPHAEDAIVLEVKDEEAEDREELPTIKTPAMASILGECLTEVPTFWHEPYRYHFLHVHGGPCFSQVESETSVF